MRVRSQDWWERVVLREFSDQEWQENFRMSRQSFVKLCKLMKNISPEEVTVRRAIPLALRVAMVLYELGTSAEYRLIANQFGVHKSTVKKFVYMFCKSTSSSLLIHSYLGRARKLRYTNTSLINTHVPLLSNRTHLPDYLWSGKPQSIRNKCIHVD